MISRGQICFIEGVSPKDKNTIAEESLLKYRILCFFLQEWIYNLLKYREIWEIKAAKGTLCQCELSLRHKNAKKAVLFVENSLIHK